MRTYWATMTASQISHHWPGRRMQYGGGYVTIQAEDRNDANNKMFDRFGRVWSLLYSNFNDMHELDQYELDTIE